MNETDCLFCKILAGTAAADVIYQDNRCVVIRDINPQAPTHLLVVPREHMESLDDASPKDEALLGHLLRISARVAYDHSLSESGGYRTVINSGSGAGQSVRDKGQRHFHGDGRGHRDVSDLAAGGVESRRHERVLVPLFTICHLLIEHPNNCVCCWVEVIRIRLGEEVFRVLV